MKSTWSPLYRGLLPAAACGPPGKKKFGNPAVWTPRQVGVVADELREAWALPHPLEERPPLFFRVVERGAVVRWVEEPALRRVQRLAYRFEVSLESGLLVEGDRCVVERRAPVGGSLV